MKHSLSSLLNLFFNSNMYSSESLISDCFSSSLTNSCEILLIFCNVYHFSSSTLIISAFPFSSSLSEILFKILVFTYNLMPLTHQLQFWYIHFAYVLLQSRHHMSRFIVVSLLFESDRAKTHAVLHCWPCISAVAEISFALRSCCLFVIPSICMVWDYK